MPPLHVTRPSLAPLADYADILAGAWKRGVLTHNGPLVQRLERELVDYLGVRHLAAVTNGTLALQLAIRALGLKGEIITTPFSWIATISSIIWEGCRPVFVDIDPETLNIDPARIEERITRHTCAILPVHVFSNPCDVAAIDEIAKRHRLKVIYDGAHAFGVRLADRPLAEAGDMTALSFHATKLFNTGEGGACVALDPELDARVRRLRFFGHNERKDIIEDGTNAKMTEIHAALGLANLRIADAVAEKRRADYERYRKALAGHSSIRFQKIDATAYNFSYMPIVLTSEEQLLKVEAALAAAQIFPRRYFFPALNTLRHIVPYETFPIAEDVSRRILCLPHYFELAAADIERVCGIILATLKD